MDSTRRMSQDAVLLTGATGFVGRHLYPLLITSGYRVRCATRNRERAERRWPEREWIEIDLDDGRRAREALDGCRAAYYLVHSMAEGRADFRTRELSIAEPFADAAAAAGVERVVYLGGVEPQTPPSEHLRSRLEVGEALRCGTVAALELRASMIVGYGSLSWLIVRDLAARLPVMVLPRWLNARTQPVAIDDVALALRRSLEIPLAQSACYDLPGPDILSGRQLLEETARLLGLPPAWMIEVPLLSPWLSSHWIRFVTRADWSVARELVVGMTADLLAQDASFWERIGHRDRLSFPEAARRALDQESAAAGPIAGGAGLGGFLEQWNARRRRFHRSTPGIG
jgi:uncharacterized protein YbjT (DUF2867 family)